MRSGKLIRLGAAIAFVGTIPLMLYANLGPKDANPVGLGMLMVASWLAGGVLAIVGAIQRFRARPGTAPVAIGAPAIGNLERTMFGDWSGEFAYAPGHRTSVMYVFAPDRPDSVPRSEVERAVREIVERVARDEEMLRARAAGAWLPMFLDECPAAPGWKAQRLARSFTLVGIILGNSHPTFILEYATTLPIDKHLKTWFNADGTFSHISGHVDQ